MKYLLRKRFLLVTVISVALMSQVSYAVPENDVMALPYVEPTETVKTSDVTITTGVVNTGTLSVRANPGTDEKLVGKIYANTKVNIAEAENGWYKITTEGLDGWVSSEYISNVTTVLDKPVEPNRGVAKRTAETATTANSKKIASIVAVAKQQVGKPYRYGSSGPNAFDCSGLVSYAYRSVGVSLPRSSSSYVSVGKTVSKANLKEGDIILFDTAGPIDGRVSHLGIYVGNRQIVHASTGGRGVVYDSIDAPYYAQRYIKAVRVLN